MGLLRRADPPTQDRIAEQINDNESLYERILEVGGVRYLPDTLPENIDFWRHHFGAQWPELMKLKSRFDPDGILTGSFGQYLVSSND